MEKITKKNDNWFERLLTFVEYENSRCFEHLPNATLDTNVKNWYLAAFPSMLFVEDIDDKITFNDVYLTLRENRDVYDTLGSEESMIRERVFMGLCIALNRDYGFVYDMWLGKHVKKENYK